MTPDAEPVRFCPGCGRADPDLVQEYWVAGARHLVCWCAGCGLMCTVVLGSLVATEPEH